MRLKIIIPEEQLPEELIKKYRWAGKIRFLSSFLLFLFLLLMKASGGYSYLNIYLSSLIFVEAILNQPYGFLLKRVNLYRFQFYQMIADIIAISWVLYYLGGIDAPVVSIVYYVVILWAGVVSGTLAVFFAVTTAAIFFAAVVICEHFAILPRLAYFSREISTVHLFSLLLSNIAFMFAFGYFSVRSSEVIRLLQKKRQEESLRHAHRLQATGYLMSETAHDLQGCLAGIKAGVQVLQSLGRHSEEENKFLAAIGDSEEKCSGLIQRLAKFSKKPKKEFMPVNAQDIIENALELTFPLVRYSQMSIEKEFGQNTPLIAADKDQLQEVFVALILNAWDSVSGKSKGGELKIRTKCLEGAEFIEIIFSDTGIGLKPDDLKRPGEPSFDADEFGKDSGLGLITVYDIIARHKGIINVQSKEGQGTIFTIQLPAVKATKVA